MNAAIETRELTKRFRRLQGYRDLLAYPWRRASLLAVDGISLRIEQGELFGLLGQNGAGKTTLIRMLSTTLLPSAGRAVVAGHDVQRAPHAVRRRIGLITGDERSFFLRLTGRQNLEFFAALFRVRPADARRRVEALAGELGLAAHLDRPFNQYSSGMRQKLAIMRGLLTEPEILFMDEPTRSLDPVSAHAVRRFVVDHVIGELGCTVVLATHSTVEAEELCHRVALIRDGALAGLGTIAELRARIAPRDEAEIRVRQLTPGLLSALGSLSVVRAVRVEPNGTSMKLRIRLAEPDVLNAVLARVLEEGALVTGCSTEQASLEDIYLATHAPNAWGEQS
ncbi:MAG TPA: ABC transporter ATP-binding protein [Candidatus Limnocylindria bacterium]|nr:ABC transporter ATP-binding protein [Candidatus Limnocylindria bacterium]